MTEVTKPKRKRRHTLEVQIERIDKQMAKLKSFEEWERDAGESARRYAIEKHGSLRGFYDAFVGSIRKLRDEHEAQLKTIRENQNGTKRR